MEQSEQFEKRVLDENGLLLSDTFGYVNKLTGKFEARNLKEYLIEIGVYEEPKEMSPDLRAYYNRLKKIVDNLK